MSVLNFFVAHRASRALLLGAAVSFQSTFAPGNVITFRDTPLGNSFSDPSGSNSDRSCNSPYKIEIGNGIADSTAGFSITAHTAADACNRGTF